MAILLLVSSYNENPPHQYEGDIIRVFDDNWQFTENELKRFGFQRVKGTADEVRKKLKEGLPLKDKAWLHADGRWYRDPPTDPKEEKEAEKKRVWKNPVDDKWYFLEDDIKFPLSVADLTQQEKDDLEQSGTVNDTAVSKTRKDYSQKPLNNTEVADLNRRVIRVG